MIYNNILEAIGNTPLIKLNHIVPEGAADVYVKNEGLDVGGSIKTRTALNMIERAEKEGKLNKDSIIVEPTSGNQGIGLALIGAVKGYRTIIVMPDSVSHERSMLVKHYGAEVILIPEVPFDFDKDVLRVILDGRNKGKRHYIVIVAEGAGSAADIATRIEKNTGIESRPTILGHLQRGGSPTLRDRTTASLMGVRAIDCLLQKRYNRIIVEKDGKITDIDLEEGLAMKKTIPEIEIDNAKRLS